MSDITEPLSNLFGRGDRVTLRIREFTSDDEANKAKHVLESLPFVEEVIINAVQGNSLNLIVKSGQSSLSKIEQSWEEVNLPTVSLAQSRPSLDDVYLAATGQTIMDAELAAASSRDMKKEKKLQMK